MEKRNRAPMDCFTACGFRTFHESCEENGNWSLFCPKEVSGFAEGYDKGFEILYTYSEKDGRPRKTVDASMTLHAVLEAQIETGTPYMM